MWWCVTENVYYYRVMPNAGMPHHTIWTYTPTELQNYMCYIALSVDLHPYGTTELYICGHIYNGHDELCR
jgi:hypothetical protein